MVLALLDMLYSFFGSGMHLFTRDSSICISLYTLLWSRSKRKPENVYDFVAPDVIKATYDGKVVELQKKEGTYTFNVDNLSKEHHQLVVSADKEGHNPGTAYLTLIVDGLR